MLPTWRRTTIGSGIRVFGCSGANESEQKAFPQARVVAVAEWGTHVVFDVAIAAYTTPENTLAPGLVDRQEPGMRLLADRGFCRLPLWDQPAATGADLLWKAMRNMKPRHVETLDDGSWLTELQPSGNAVRLAEPLMIRVIDYEIDDRRVNDNPYRLFTTILDPDDAPAVELARAYSQRWEIEATFDELKGQQHGPSTVMRSGTVGRRYRAVDWG